METGLPPWHMWGNTLSSELITKTSAPFPKDSQQLLRINYARPETWRFFFAAELIDGDTGTTGGDLIVDFSLTIGVGRTSFTLVPAPRFQFTWAAAVPVHTRIFSTTIDGPIKDSAFPLRPNILETLSAQDIQVTTNLLFTGNNVDGGDRVKVAFTALFTPNVHVRPEWHNRRYPGNETEGR